MSYLEGRGSTDNTRLVGIHPISLQQNSSFEKDSLCCLGHRVFLPLVPTQVTLHRTMSERGSPGFWSLTLQLPITHRLKAPWCSGLSCSHLVPSMKLYSRLTMNSFSTALHMCLHCMSPGGGRQEEQGVTLSEKHTTGQQTMGRSQKNLIETALRFHLETKTINEMAFRYGSRVKPIRIPLDKEPMVSQPLLTFGKANSRSPSIKGWRFFAEIQRL